MKNLKIGTKITLGFGVVIFMMLVIAVVVVITSINSIRDQKKITLNAGLQTLSATLQNDYLNARVPANLLYNTMDPAVYQQFLDLSATTEQGFADIIAYIDANPYLEEYRAPIDAAHQAYAEWAENANLIGKLNEEQARQYEIVLEKRDALIETTSYLLTDQIDTLRNQIGADLETVHLMRQSRRLESVISINQDITNARILSRNILDTYNPASLGEAITSFDMAIAATTTYNEGSATTSQQAAAQKAISAISVYRDTIESFGKACLESSAAKDRMPALNQIAQQAFNEADAAIELAVTDIVAATTRSSTISLTVVIIMSGFALAASIFMAVIIMRSITVPVEKMHRVAEIVGNTGRMIFSNEEMNDVKSGISQDEIGKSIRAFVNMIDRLTVVASALEHVSAGDLTVDLKPISNEDTIGVALSTMVENLNQMFTEINTSTIQVSSGSSQIADGAQMLAQGAVAQSATVEQLSASVAEVAEKTKANASVAKETHDLEDNIKRDAERGAEQMGQMMQAVQDISEASQSIGKVIKIIDDIAFQTNILALNAAVEAARAGQHGKGFAVVADEVRNLAAKSASAAKDTGELIETSIQKAEMGASISQGTSQSLSRIVDGILQSSKLVADIARSSGEQTAAISQISESIDQVSHIVQQNSATAEQSAAASEEMNNQAALLKQLISKFKLKSYTDASTYMSPDSQHTGFSINKGASK